MEVIQSFTVDHTRLKPGIYISREDKGFTTFDLRITEPNREPAVSPSALHSMEHLMATWFPSIHVCLRAASDSRQADADRETSNRL